MVVVQSVDTFHPFVSGNIGTIFLPMDAQLGSVTQWVAASVALADLILAAFPARWAAKQWRLKHFTKECANTIEFLIANPHFWTLKRREEVRQNVNDTLLDERTPP